jgi:divalent metal cation (Fe/Co/Zn/Cd) transporter
LFALGGDSAIELSSAVIVLWRFRATAAHEEAEKRAARVAGAILFALAAYVAVSSTLSLLGYSRPQPSLVGIAILVAALAIMPWFAREKRRLSAAAGSVALRADAAQAALCAYLSFIALAGLAVNAIWQIAWADPVAAVLIIPWFCEKARKQYEANLAAAAEKRTHSKSPFGCFDWSAYRPSCIVINLCTNQPSAGSAVAA